MDYAQLLKSNADATDIQKYLIGGETVAVTIRIPKNLRDSAKDEASRRGSNFSALVRECMIEELSKKRG
jgi:predicted DNA binding CopG/RHH family protein